MASSAIYAQLDTTTLIDVLTQERTNLAIITTQSSCYTSSELPLHQHNQAHDILQRIQQITMELTTRGVTIPPPHSQPTTIADLTAQTVAVLLPAMPMLASIGEGFANELGNEGYQSAQGLLNTIKQWFHQTPDPNAEKALRNFEDDPETYADAFA